MTVVLDTTVLIDWLRDRAGARAALHGLVASGELVTASVVTRTEVLTGLRSSERRDYDEVLRVPEWITVSEDIAELAGEWNHRFLRSHTSIGLGDYLVAATAQTLGAKLWTHNVKHFPMFPDLERPY
ncbi:MAG: type II toxin-antitoxin system VapC family toxin [Nocardioides sp.]|uniref:type II toxin-antitoxin system VapC family toxin n=1 Tax=Nocardioides sp. TaxID=35761 RepID=UPI0039E2214B